MEIKTYSTRVASNDIVSTGMHAENEILKVTLQNVLEPVNIALIRDEVVDLVGLEVLFGGYLANISTKTARIVA